MLLPPNVWSLSGIVLSELQERISPFWLENKRTEASWLTGIFDQVLTAEDRLGPTCLSFTKPREGRAAGSNAADITELLPAALTAGSTEMEGVRGGGGGELWLGDKAFKMSFILGGWLLWLWKNIDKMTYIG